MDSENKQRGYDDRALLKRMADGLVSREFGSVDEAAKSVLGEESSSNVDRLRRKFREQGWYERGLNDHVEAQIAARGLVKPNFGAKICIWIENAFRDPLPVLERLMKLQHVLVIRNYDVDGRRITKLEKLGGFFRICSTLTLPFCIFSAFIYLIRRQSTEFGLELLQFAALLLMLAFGMFWNRVAVGGDIDGLYEADRNWRKVEREKRAERRRRFVEEFEESKVKRQQIELETA
jgi:hypothetical protein